MAQQNPANLLDELLSRFNALPPDEQKELKRLAVEGTQNMTWVPQPGPQTDGYLTEADETFYGGQAGGGKTDLGIGLALTAHTDSLLLRRFNKDARDLSDRIEAILGNTDGRNNALLEWNLTDRHIEIGGCPHEKDKQRFKGRPHDLIFFDEISDFTKSQFVFIKIWLRTVKEGQRCRVVCAGNPPTTAEGLWIIEYWAAWLDPRHPNPAKPGELRWYVSDELGKDQEVPGPGKYTLTHDDGKTEEVIARSRTFIRAKLEDNLYLANTDYAATLDALPAELRAAYRDGRFDLSLKDNPKQVIPTSWIMAAIERGRRHPNPPSGVPMCAMGIDPAAGGEDDTIIAPRYDAWWPAVTRIPGKKTPLGSDVAGAALARRRDNALPIVDCGGGYGGGVIQTFEQNNIKYVAYKGAEGSTARTKDGKLKFRNKRTQVYWQFRELLDPDQPGGSPACLPDSAFLIADLAAVYFDISAHGIDITTKEDVCDKLGRSPDEGDAVTISWFDGSKLAHVKDGDWKKHSGRPMPTVNMGHAGRRR